jgi:predicted dehydrogenase
MRVGVVGCGVIARSYVADSSVFDSWQPIACADLDLACAKTFASEHGLRAEPFEALVADPEVELVLNLTPPNAHALVSRAALAAGKHVYSEKPLAVSVRDGRELVSQAHRSGLRLGCAPDTFLGSAYQTGKRLIEEGAIGMPLGAAATILVGGPDPWHPNAEIFFRAGGGPLLDLAPYYLTALVALLGRIESVSGFAVTRTPERTLGVGPRAGEKFAVDVPTHVAAVLRLEGGVLATLTVSFEALGQYVSGLEVFGSESTLCLPDANAFGGDVVLRRGRSEPEQVSYTSLGGQETRGIGLHRLVESIRGGRPQSAGDTHALHVLEAVDAIIRSAAERRVVDLPSAGWDTALSL